LKENKMKTQNIILTLGALAFTITVLNVNAGVLLSPRAAGNQIVTVKSTAGPALTSDPAPAVRAALSPRAAGNQIVTVKGTSASVAVSCIPLGSPKHVATVGKAAKMSCCNLTIGECATMSAMNQ
jgi:hypothetical protein